MNPQATETIFQALYTLLSQAQMLTNGAPNGTPAFVTTGRKCPQVSSVGAALQPAMYIMEGGVRIVPKAGLNLPKYQFEAAAIVFFRNEGGDTGIPSTQMNELWDALDYQFTQNTLATDLATVVPLLGGRNRRSEAWCTMLL